MKTIAWLEGTLLIALAIGGAWYFWHGYVLMGVALVAAAFAVIVGAHLRARREVWLKKETLREAAENDGRYVAALIDDLEQTQIISSEEVPEDPREILGALLSEISQGLGKPRGG
jgi:hypothetical protein